MSGPEALEEDADLQQASAAGGDIATADVAPAADDVATADTAPAAGSGVIPAADVAPAAAADHNEAATAEPTPAPSTSTQAASGAHAAATANDTAAAPADQMAPDTSVSNAGSTSADKATAQPSWLSSLIRRHSKGGDSIHGTPHSAGTGSPITRNSSEAISILKRKHSESGGDPFSIAAAPRRMSVMFDEEVDEKPLNDQELADEQPGIKTKWSAASSHNSGSRAGYGRRQSLGEMSFRKSGTFRISTAGEEVQRKDMIEFLNFLRFSRTVCCSIPYTIVFWLLFLLLVMQHNHVSPSFDLQDSLKTYIVNITADQSRGLAPRRVWAADAGTGTSCHCTCVPGDASIEAFCKAGGESSSLPHVSYQGEVDSDRLLRMQTASEYSSFRRSIEAGTPTHEEDRSNNDWNYTLEFEDVESIDDVWFWIQHGFIPALWHETAEGLPVYMRDIFGSNAALSRSNSGKLLSWNAVIGGVRMRQYRLTETDCTERQDVVDFYHLVCHSKKETDAAFSVGARHQAEGFIATADESFDVYLDISLPVHLALENVEYMLKEHQWLDSSTKELVLQVPLLNAESVPALYGLLEVRFAFDSSGATYPSLRVGSTAVVIYNSFFALLLDIAWILLLTSLLVWKLAWGIVDRAWRKPCGAWSTWSALEWATMLLGFCLIFAWAVQIQATSSLTDSVESLPAAPEYGAPYSVITSYHEAWGAVLDDIDDILVMRGHIQLGMFWYTLLLIVFSCRNFQGQPRLAQLSGAVLVSIVDLFHWLCVFVVAFISFAFGAFLIFGLSLEEWSTPSRAMNSTFAALMGDVDLMAMFEVAPVSTVAWHGLFTLSLVLVMTNLFLAITFDHYHRIRSNTGATTGVVSQAKVAIGDWRFRTSMRCCSRRQGGVSAPPKCEDMLDEIMQVCNYSSDQKGAVKQTVTGPKLVRRHLEEAVFAGHAEAVEMTARCSEDVQGDLEDLGVDFVYADWLTARCREHVSREYNTADFQLAQLRELVVQAETEMARMKDRLELTRGSLKMGILDVSKRMATLEKAIHTSLAELVLIAGSAGVHEKAYKEPGVSENDRAKTNSVFARVVQHIPDPDKLAKEKDVVKMHRAHRLMRARTTQAHRLKGPALEESSVGRLF